MLSDFICPRLNLVTEDGRKFGVTAACQLWNFSSLELKNSGSIESSKTNYRNIHLGKYPPSLVRQVKNCYLGLENASPGLLLFEVFWKEFELAVTVISMNQWAFLWNNLQSNIYPVFQHCNWNICDDVAFLDHKLCTRFSFYFLFSDETAC